jgi:drug/metabolite transporter (DMT)-like permease
MLWSYVALIVAVLSMSAGGLWFALLPESPPLMKAFWRLFLTAVLQCAGFFHQSRGLPPEFWSRYRSSAGKLLVIGLSLGAHFGAWGWSVDHTSLAHSLLLVWTTPLLMVALMLARAVLHSRGVWVELGEAPGAPPPKPLGPTVHETCGAVLGFAGVAMLLASGAERSNEVAVSLAGDAAALLGAAAIIPYLEGGANLRAWMPLFVYALPVTLGAAVWLGLASLLLEGNLGATVGGVGPASLFGFLGSPRRFGLSFGAALVSGILGHTLVNLALKHLSPLLISVSCLWEPLLGGVLGYLVGVQGPPSVITAVAAPLILLGGALVTLGARKPEASPQQLSPEAAPQQQPEHQADPEEATQGSLSPSAGETQKETL